MARNILLTLAENASLALFGPLTTEGEAVVPPALREKGSFSTASLSKVVGDRSLLGSKISEVVCAVLKVASLSFEARLVVRIRRRGTSSSGVGYHS